MPLLLRGGDMGARLTEKRNKKIYADYAQCGTYAAAAKLNDVSNNTVKNVVKEFGNSDFAEKCKIVCEFAEKGVPLHRICAENHVSRSAVESWTRIYKKGGYEALRDIKPQGRPKNMGRPKKKEPQTELERLRYENEYLRAEVALLKKVKALVEEREKRLHEIGRKPSKH